jgi:hypothetical protein
MSVLADDASVVPPWCHNANATPPQIPMIRINLIANLLVRLPSLFIFPPGNLFLIAFISVPNSEIRIPKS